MTATVTQLDPRWIQCPHCKTWIRKDARTGPCPKAPKGAA